MWILPVPASKLAAERSLRSGSSRMPSSVPPRVSVNLTSTYFLSTAAFSSCNVGSGRRLAMTGCSCVNFWISSFTNGLLRRIVPSLECGTRGQGRQSRGSALQVRQQLPALLLVLVARDEAVVEEALELAQPVRARGSGGRGEAGADAGAVLLGRRGDGALEVEGAGDVAVDGHAGLARGVDLHVAEAEEAAPEGLPVLDVVDLVEPRIHRLPVEDPGVAQHP